MRVIYCRKYEKYASQQHCEFFNDGFECESYTPTSWNSIKELAQDEERPKREVAEIIKPFNCFLMKGTYGNSMDRRLRVNG